MRVLQSSSAVRRLAAAAEFVRSHPAGTEVLLIGSTREAVDDFVRRISVEAGATFGLHRFTLKQLAARFEAAQDKQAFLDLVRRLNGSFAIVLRKEDRLYAAVDRVRSMPLFYTQTANGLVMSDEAAWVRAQQPEAQINQIAASEFLLTGYVTGGETLYQSVHQLRAGQYLFYDDPNGQMEEALYYEYRHCDFSHEPITDLIGAPADLSFTTAPLNAPPKST